jgi:hypothetical protein
MCYFPSRNWFPARFTWAFPSTKCLLQTNLKLRLRNRFHVRPVYCSTVPSIAATAPWAGEPEYRYGGHIDTADQTEATHIEWFLITRFVYSIGVLLRKDAGTACNSELNLRCCLMLYRFNGDTALDAMTSSSDYHSSLRGQHSSKLAQGTTPRAAPSKLTEDQLLLLQQQWSQKHPRLRSDQRSARSTRSSVSGVQYSRVFSRPVSSSCAGRCPTPQFEAPGSIHPPLPNTSTATYGNTISNGDLGSAGFASSAAVQQQQQQQQQEVLLQPRLTVWRRADVGTGEEGWSRRGGC